MGRLGRGSCFGRRANSSGALVLIGETYPLDTLIAETRASRFASVDMPRVCMHVCVCVCVCVGGWVWVCVCSRKTRTHHRKKEEQMQSTKVAMYVCMYVHKTRRV